MDFGKVSLRVLLCVSIDSLRLIPNKILVTGTVANKKTYMDVSAKLTTGTATDIDVQNPLPTDGDSVYEKDIWLDESSSINFSGSVTDLFNNLHSQQPVFFWFLVSKSISNSSVSILDGLCKSY